MSKKDTLTIERRVYIGAPVENVWRALTDPAMVSLYHLVPLQGIDLNIGGEMAFIQNGERHIEARITDLSENARLVHTFHFTEAAHPGVDDHLDPTTTVTYELTPMNKMSLLHLVHSGFPAANTTYKFASVGWDTIFSGMKTLLETGEELPWPRDG